MPTAHELLLDSARILERSVSELLTEGRSKEAQEFYALRLQLTLFNFDVSRELLALVEPPLSGFPLHASARSLAHKLYEFDATLSGASVSRVTALAAKRSLPLHTEAFKREAQKWKAERKKLRAWKAMRDQTSGHYGSDVMRQVQLIAQLHPDEVLEVAGKFLEYLGFYINVLYGIGRGRAVA